MLVMSTTKSHNISITYFSKLLRSHDFYLDYNQITIKNKTQIRPRRILLYKHGQKRTIYK